MKNADVHAAKLTSQPRVSERIEELKTEAAEKCSLSREAYIKSLVEMYEALPSEASMDNPRCDVVVVRGQKQAVFPPKLQVGQQLAKLVNWEGSIKVELEAGEPKQPRKQRQALTRRQRWRRSAIPSGG